MVYPETLMICWESPYPAFSGLALRHLGLLQQLARFSKVRLFIVTKVPLKPEQYEFLGQYATDVFEIPRLDVTRDHKIKALFRMITSAQPWHNSVADLSLRATPNLRDEVLSHNGLVYFSKGLFGTLLMDKKRENFVLDQQDEDVHIWTLRAERATKFHIKQFWRLNRALSAFRFKDIYKNAGRVVSVCEEDAELTRAVQPTADVVVIKNGVDAAYFHPDRSDVSSRQMLFTGTSVERNMIPLRSFVKGILPKVLAAIPDATLLVAGDFKQKARDEFASEKRIVFTGRVDDIRPYYNESGVYVAPFSDAHGSKLKITQALAMGIPIVSTESGIRGFEGLSERNGVSLAETDQEFADRVIDLMNNPVKAGEIGTNGRAFVEEQLDWNVLGEELNSMVRSMKGTWTR